MHALLRERGFGLYWASSVISAIGNALLVTTLPYYVFVSTHSPLASGAAFIMAALPRVVMSTLGGVYADRWERRRAVVLSDYARGLLLIPLVLAQSPLLLWAIFLVSFCDACVAYFASPFGHAILPQLVPRDQIPTANSLFALGGGAAGLVGPVFAAPLLQQFGLRGPVLIDSLSFLLSGFIVSTIKINKEEPTNSIGHRERTPIWRELNNGWHWIRAERKVVLVCAYSCLCLCSTGMLTVVLIPFVKTTLGANLGEYGAIRSSMAVGGICGTAALGLIVGRTRPTRLSLYGSGLAAVCIGLCAMAQNNTMALLTMAARVPASIACDISARTILQQHVDQEYQGRVFGFLGSASGVSIFFGMVLAALLTDAIGPLAVMVSSALCAAGASIVAYAGATAAAAHGRRETADALSRGDDSA